MHMLPNTLYLSWLCKRQKGLSNPRRRMQTTSMHSWTASPALQELCVRLYARATLYVSVCVCVRVCLQKNPHILNRKCNWELFKASNFKMQLHPENCMHAISKCMNDFFAYLQGTEVGALPLCWDIFPSALMGEGSTKDFAFSLQ